MTTGTKFAQQYELARFRFLIVDDEPFTRQVIASALRGMNCLKLMFAHDGQEALDRLENSGERVDFVLSDFQMPRLTGLQLLKSIRCGVRGISNKTRFGLLTGYSDIDIVGAAFRLDVDCFLTKPVTMQTLNDRLGQSLSRDRTLEGPAHYQPVQVDIRKSMSVAATAKVAAAAVDDAPPPPARLVSVQSIVEGSLLLEDLHTTSGELILKQGHMLSRRILDLLGQLAEIDPLFRYIQVSPPETT